MKSAALTPLAIVVRTAGTNCDRETCLALERAGARFELVHLRRLIENPARLDAAALVVFPGGFSHGDDVAAGRIKEESSTPPRGAGIQSPTRP